MYVAALCSALHVHGQNGLLIIKYLFWPRRLRAGLGGGGTTVTKNLDFLFSSAQIKIEAVSHTGGIHE